MTPSRACGSCRTEVAPGRIDNTRELLVQRLPYVIVYEVFDERVLILNIVHAAQKWPN